MRRKKGGREAHEKKNERELLQRRNNENTAAQMKPVGERGPGDLRGGRK